MFNHLHENPTREKIIFLLKKNGPLSIENLSNELHITSMGIRQHLLSLERKGYIDYVTKRQGIGRPAFVYRLTEKAQTLFPMAYDKFIIETFKEIERNEAIAISDKQFQLSYRDLRDTAEFLAAKMKSSGLKGGDKIGLLYARSPEYIAASFAVIRAGGIAVTIPRASRPAEIAKLADAMALDGFCYSDRFEALMPPGEESVSMEAPMFAGQWLSCFKRAAHSNTLENEREHLQSINAANIRFSSGTTSESKGIIVSHETILNRARIHRKIFSVTNRDRMLFLLSMMRALPTPVCA